jgi:hypothetical protein
MSPCAWIVLGAVVLAVIALLFDFAGIVADWLRSR